MEWDSCSRLFRTNSNEPFAPFFVGTKKFLESFTPSRLHFKCKFQAWFELSNIIISRVSRFLSSSGSRWSFLKPSFGSTINICLRINNYARISSFISCPQFFFFFQRDERMVGHGRRNGYEPRSWTQFPTRRGILMKFALCNRLEYVSLACARRANSSRPQAKSSFDARH